MAGGQLISPIIQAGSFDGTVPHLLSGTTKVNGTLAPCRVEVLRRRSGAYVISTVSGDDGVFAFRHLPVQSADDPYKVICTPTNTDAYNAQVYDQVRQVNDDGDPPTESFTS